MSGIEIKPRESGWTEEDLVKLFAAMKRNVPERYSRSIYSRGLKHVNWNEVAFPPFSSQECQKKWTEVLRKMRKTRTLRELIDEAEKTLSSAAFSYRLHPTLLKKPTPPSALFYEANWAKFQEEHPQMSQQKLLQFVTKQYKELPDEEKAQYVEKYKRASEEYAKRKLEIITPKQKRKRNSAETPDLLMAGGPHTIDDRGLPPKPPANGYQLFCKEQVSSVAGVSQSNYLSVWAQRWQDLTEKQRVKYSSRCTEMKEKYAIELNEYLNTFNDKEQQQILIKNGLKRPKMHKHHGAVKLVKTFPGEPKMPSQSSHIIFCKHQMEHLKEEFPNSKVRFSKANQMWQDLPLKEKKSYKRQLAEKLAKYSEELQEWFKTLTAAEQKDYRENNRRKCKYLDAEESENDYERNKLYLHRSSDSEDETNISSSSSEEEKYIFVCDKEEEEEEEEDQEGDITFQMY